MSTQQSGGTPHTCKALEHCHRADQALKIGNPLVELAAESDLRSAWKQATR